MLLKYNFHIEELEIDKDLNELVLIGSRRSHFKEEFKLLKTISNNHSIYRYLPAGRIGYIKVIFKKEKGILLLEVFEAPFGFAVPLFFLINAIVTYFFLENTSGSMFLFFVGFFWFLLVCYFFFDDSKHIEKHITTFFSTQ